MVVAAVEGVEVSKSDSVQGRLAEQKASAKEERRNRSLRRVLVRASSPNRKPHIDQVPQSKGDSTVGHGAVREENPLKRASAAHLAQILT